MMKVVILCGGLACLREEEVGGRTAQRFKPVGRGMAAGNLDDAIARRR
jgi:hypothetical protein